MLVYSLAYYSTLKMEVTCFSFVAAIKPKSEYRFHSGAILLFYMQQKTRTSLQKLITSRKAITVPHLRILNYELVRSSRNAVDIYSEGTRFEIWAGTATILTYVVRGLPRFVQTTAEIRSLFLNFKFFHHSSVILPFDAIVRILTSSSNKPQNGILN
jgi:hypothetical protein